MTASPSGVDPEFARAWLEEQKAFWARFGSRPQGADFAAAEAAWELACERWWRNVGSAVPGPMSGAVRAALRQTRVLLHLAGSMAEADASMPGHVVDPAMLLDAALQAMSPQPVTSAEDDEAEAAYMRAYAAMMAALVDIARETADAVRDRLARAGVMAPREVYAVYAEEVEAHYRTRAGSETFARLVGDLVNTQVVALAARRGQQP